MNGPMRTAGSKVSIGSYAFVSLPKAASPCILISFMRKSISLSIAIFGKLR